MFEKYKLDITPLTPMHIGTGEQISPGDYFLFEEEGKRFLYATHLDAIPDKEFGKYRGEVLAWIVANPVTWISNVKTRPGLIELIKAHSRFKCRVQGTTFNALMKRPVKGTSELGISTMTRSPKGVIIPGSSIKGAIRTALVWNRAEKPLCRVSFDVSEWERTVLSENPERTEIHDDLLRHLKIADSRPTRISSWVLLPEHFGMSSEASDKNQVLNDYREFLPGASREKPYRLSAEMVITRETLRRNRLTDKLSADYVLESCRKFYLAALEAEIAYWKDGDTDKDREVTKSCEELRDYAAQHPDAALIRMGWGCGMNSIGLNIAKPDTDRDMGRNDTEFRRYPATRILAAKLPPGWALMTMEKV